jgi:hypothetical protein
MGPLCPSCGSYQTHRSRRRFYERIFSLFDHWPYRCFACESRFYTAYWSTEQDELFSQKKPGVYVTKSGLPAKDRRREARPPRMPVATITPRKADPVSPERIPVAPGRRSS